MNKYFKVTENCNIVTCTLVSRVYGEPRFRKILYFTINQNTKVSRRITRPTSHHEATTEDDQIGPQKHYHVHALGALQSPASGEQ